MRKILRYISAGLGFISFFISVGGFLYPLIYPYTYGRGSMSSESFAAGILFLPIGFVFRFLSLYDKPKLEKLIQIIKELFAIIAIESLGGITSLIGIIFITLGIGGYVLFDNVLDKVRKKAV